MDECMKFYNETKPLYQETDASGVGVGAGTAENMGEHKLYQAEAIGHHNIMT